MASGVRLSSEAEFRKFSRLSSKDSHPDEDSVSDLLCTLILTGSFDMFGNPLIIFPKECDAVIGGNNDDVVYLMLMYYDVVQIVFRKKRVAFLAEVQSGSCSVTLVQKCLDELERQRPGSVAILYIVKSKALSRTKTLKKLLGIKSSKKKSVTFSHNFKTVTVTSLPELHSHIDSSQLTAEFGGQITYDHEAWVHVFRDILPSIRKYETMIGKLEGLSDRSLLLQEYDTRGYSCKQLQDLRSEVENNFKLILSDSGIIDVLEQCRATLQSLDQPQDENAPICRINKSFFLELSTYIRNVFMKLTSTKSAVCGIWAAVDESIETNIKITQKVEDTEKLCMKISETFWPLLSPHPQIGGGLADIDKRRQQFTLGLYNPAKEIVNEATGILEAVRCLQLTEERHVTAVKEIARRLNKTVDPFAKQLGELNNVYTSVHIFHLVFQKCLVWYRKTLNFIPRSLCDHAVRVVDDRISVPCPAWWFQAVQDFLQKHPAPREDHVSLIDGNSPQAVDQLIKTQAIMLANRVRVLIDVLMSSQIETMSLCNVLMWKKDEESGNEPFVSIYNDSDDHQHQKTLPRTKPSNPTARIKRRISRSKTMRSEIRSRMYQSLPRLERKLNSRSSSTDTENLRDFEYDIDQLSYVGYPGSFSRSSSANQLALLDTYSVKSMPTVDLEPRKTDKLMDEIQQVASAKYIDNETKLRYVSDLVTNLSIQETVSQEGPRSARRYSKRKINPARYKTTSPAHHVAELNSRLSRSLDNIMNVIMDEEYSKPEVYRKSMFDIRRQQSDDTGEDDAGTQFPRSVDSVNKHDEHTNGVEIRNNEDDDNDDSCPDLKEEKAVSGAADGDMSLEHILEFERKEYRRRKENRLQSGFSAVKDEYGRLSSDGSVFDVTPLSSNSFDDEHPVSHSRDVSQAWSSDLGYDSQIERASRVSGSAVSDINNWRKEWKV